MNVFRCIAAAVAAAAVCALPVSAAAASPSTAALQVALRARGLYAGTVDGVRGPGTAGAIRAFQARAGLMVDGIAGPLTRRRLGWRGRPWLGRRGLRGGRPGWGGAALQFLLHPPGFPPRPRGGGPRAPARAAPRPLP